MNHDPDPTGQACLRPGADESESIVEPYFTDPAAAVKPDVISPNGGPRFPRAAKLSMADRGVGKLIMEILLGVAHPTGPRATGLGLQEQDK